MPPCQGVEHYITTIAIKGYIPGVARAGGTDGIQLRFTESSGAFTLFCRVVQIVCLP